MNISGPLNIIYFGSVDWNYTWQRPQQLASRLARFGRLLYVNPLGLRSIRASDLRRIIQSAENQIAPPVLSAPPPTLTVCTSPFYIPFPNNPRASQWNGRILRRQLNKWLQTHDITSPIIWVGTPSFAALEAIRGLDRGLLVYDCLDNFSMFHKNPFHIIEAEESLSAQADILFATAHELYERFKSVNPFTFLVPNADEWEHFAPSPNHANAIPADIIGLPKPIIGYFGEIAEWFDLDLIVTTAMEHPEWTIVLIGPVHHPSSRQLLQCSNIHLLGRKPYVELPRYLNQFDVCILPFKINALTSAVNPIKLYEYLAAGKAVVSTPLRETLEFQSVIRIADRAHFVTAIRETLQAADSPEVIQRRMQVARQNTWDQRVEEIVRLIAQQAGASSADSGTI